MNKLCSWSCRGPMAHPRGGGADVAPARRPIVESRGRGTRAPAVSVSPGVQDDSSVTNATRTGRKSRPRAR
jgi:hypothetical protein